MSGFAALHYDGTSTRPRPVQGALRSGRDGRPELHLEGLDAPCAVGLDRLRIHDRVGGAARLVELPGGAWLEIAAEPDPFDAPGGGPAGSRAGRLVRALEQHWVAAVAAVLASAASIWLFVQFGLPALAARAAAMLPASIERELGSVGLEALDRQVLAPTRLSAARQAGLRRAFDAMARDLGGGEPLRLEFRRGGELGANALALPGGSIVLTDELAAIARHDDELRAVFAHEIGHVVHDHSLRILLQSSGSALLMLALVGDLSTAGSLAASIPTVLVHAAHSRAFEREADRFAREWMRTAGVPGARLDALLERLESERGSAGWSYLSTHPPLDERLAR